VPGRRWRIRLSEAAEQDFVSILRWTAETFGPRQARTYRETLLTALTALADGPDVIGSRPRDEIQPGLRTLHVARHRRRGRHIILYRTAGADTIEVLRILHEAMDLPRHVPQQDGDDSDALQI
jgi:toxin ParE1/3/4